MEYFGQLIKEAYRTFDNLELIRSIEESMRNVEYADVERYMELAEPKTPLQRLDVLACCFFMNTAKTGMPHIPGFGVTSHYCAQCYEDIDYCIETKGVSVVRHKESTVYFCFNRVFILHDKIRKEDFTPYMVFNILYDSDVYNILDNIFSPISVAIRQKFHGGMYEEWLCDYVASCESGCKVTKDIAWYRAIIDRMHEIYEDYMFSQCKFFDDYVYINKTVYKLGLDGITHMTYTHLKGEEPYIYVLGFAFANKSTRVGVLDTKHNVLVSPVVSSKHEIHVINDAEIKRKLLLT